MLLWQRNIPRTLLGGGVELHCGSKVLELKDFQGYPRAQILYLKKY